MIMRDDISTKLVHLTKGLGEEEANHRKEAGLTLESILKDGFLKGGCGYIKGKHKCVCFSEAPISKLSYLLANNNNTEFKYQPYGVLVDKKAVYAAGGRPVIYGPDGDYDLLPKEMKYRHVRFELCETYEVNHTWEREWRINTTKFYLNPKTHTIVLPNREAKDAFQRRYSEFHYIALSDLGVEIDPFKN